MDLILWLVIGLILLAILVTFTLGRQREPHVGAPPDLKPWNRPSPPADDAGHQGSFTRPPDTARGDWPGAGREPPPTRP
jgi:hypothetical protein